VSHTQFVIELAMKGQRLLGKRMRPRIVALAPGDPSEIMKRGRDPLLITNFAPDCQALFKECARSDVVALILSQSSCAYEKLRSRLVANSSPRQHLRQLLMSFT